MDLSIVVIAYNRDESLKRLLKSVASANYNKKNINLIISIDKSTNQRVYLVAEEFKWEYGKKIIIKKEKQLGLRNHVIECGDLTEEFENIIVLEDDLVVSQNFYLFAEQSLQFYITDKNIAGVSLYSHRYHLTNLVDFDPINQGNDNYFLQFASSWGQVWSSEQWKSFKNWYNENQDIDFSPNEKIPRLLSSWPDSSWLKFFVLYCIVSDRFFVYPYYSLTTNFTDIGTNSNFKDPTYQVSLDYRNQPDYDFAPFTEGVKYDAYFEIINDKQLLSAIPKETRIDVFGQKILAATDNYVLSTKIMDFEIVKSFDLSLRPIEMNVIMDLSGDVIFLYNLNRVKKNYRKNQTQLLLYNNKKKSLKSLVKFLWLSFKINLSNRFKR